MGFPKQAKKQAIYWLSVALQIHYEPEISSPNKQQQAKTIKWNKDPLWGSITKPTRLGNRNRLLKTRARTTIIPPPSILDLETDRLRK